MNGWPPFKRFSLRLTFSASAASTQAAKDCGALLPLWVNSTSQARRAVPARSALTLTPRTFLVGFFCRPWSGLLAMLALLALLSLLASLALLAMLAKSGLYLRPAFKKIIVRNEQNVHYLHYVLFDCFRL